MIHSRHATFYLFYAKFPNEYLRDIANYGHEYKAKADTLHEIHLQQSRPFRMRDPHDQAGFFKLIAKLFYYLVSGKSHVGYLAAEPWNRYFKSLKVCPLINHADSQAPKIYDSIVVAPWQEAKTTLSDAVLDKEGYLDGELKYGDVESMEIGLPSEPSTPLGPFSPVGTDTIQSPGSHVPWAGVESPRDES